MDGAYSFSTGMGRLVIARGTPTIVLRPAQIQQPQRAVAFPLDDLQLSRGIQAARNQRPQGSSSE